MSDADQGDELNDSVIMINGGQIQAREIRDSPDAQFKGGSAYKQRRNEMNNIIKEETKINFYDPSRYGKDPNLYQIEKEEDE